MVGKNTRKLIVLAQSLEAKWQMGEEAASHTDHWGSAPAKDGKEDGYGGEVFELSPNHKALIVLKSGTFSCANCEYVNEKKHECNNKYYIKWNGGSKSLPDAPLDKICSDFFSPKKE